MKDKKMMIAPSILGADFANLQKELESVNTAEYIHVDIMDGMFVPNISIGIPVVESLKKITAIPLDVHLMITKPERYIERFIKAGADILTIHLESTTCPHECLAKIKELGCIPAISVKPNTPIDEIFPFLDEVGLVLVMSVEPGFGGQKMIITCLEKCIELKKEINRRKSDVLIEIDGGITKENIVLVKNSGVDISVVGSALFGMTDRLKTIEELR